MSNNIRERLSRLMRMSWDIQKGKHKTRSNALKAAWAILGNEDISVHYLVKKLNHNRSVPEKAINQMGLFSS